jgi:hypothetical protein
MNISNDNYLINVNMICKLTQGIIDTLLRLKTKEDLAVDAINKIASLTTQPITTNKKVGEVAELQSLLNAYSRHSNPIYPYSRFHL